MSMFGSGNPLGFSVARRVRAGCGQDPERVLRPMPQEENMKPVRIALLALFPLLAVGACTTLSDQDRAMIAAASQNADQAKQQSAQALAVAQAAQASATQAAADAKA